MGLSEQTAFQCLEAWVAQAVQVGPDVPQPVHAQFEVLGKLPEERGLRAVRSIGELGDDPVGAFPHLDEVEFYKSGK